MNYVGMLVEYVIVFILILLVNYIVFIKKNKNYNPNKASIEVVYLCNIYKINIKKVNYKHLLWTYSLINTFIISTVYIICIYLIKGIVFQILIGVVLLALLIIICYELLGRYYKKKGSN